jgi:integrase
MTGKKGRASGEGHVRYNERLRVWEARLYVPVKLRPLYGGKRVIPFYSKDQSKALEKRAAAKRDMDEGRGRAKGLLFGDYLSRWLDTLASLKTVSDATLSDYRYYSERHLIPNLGTVPLSDLTAEDLDLLYARLSKAGAGPRAINHVHSTARVALQRAVKKRLIPFNPARDADPPRYSTDEREYLTLSEEEVGRFFSALDGDRFEAFFVAAVLSGMRPAELRALAWEDADLERGIATVRRTVSQGRTGPPEIRNTTKTRKARAVPLLPEVVAALRSHKARQNEERLALKGLWQDRGLVFPDATGGIIRRENLSRRHFKPALKRAGLPEAVRVYDLRHTFGTLWAEAGEDSKILQRILGHARISTTLDKYVHPSDRARDEAMSRFGARFKKPS